MQDPHEIIKQRQIKESIKYINSKPSKCKKIYWIYATRQDKNSYPESTINSGKYIIFCDSSEVNNTWLIIKTATEKGFLGDASKVSTKTAIRMRKNQSKGSNKHVICIYTYSFYDYDDRNRIEKNLNKVVPNVQFKYKTNQQTLDGY
jgi:hypothetical protein